MGSSCPCQDCHQKLLKLGVKKIVYSNDENKITSCKPCEYESYGPSLGRKYIECDFKIIRD